MASISIYFEEDELAIVKLLKILLDIMIGALSRSDVEDYTLFCSNVKNLGYPGRIETGPPRVQLFNLAWA